MSDFVRGIRRETNSTYTENGQLAYKSTAYSKVLDFYAIAGAMRTRSEAEIKTKMAEAFAENPLLATRLLFFLSDIREGLGERRTFRVALKWLAENHPDVVKVNIDYISHFNRWDSIFVLKGTPAEDAMVALVKEQLKKDLKDAAEGANISLLAKWMPSINTSCKETCKLGHWFARKLDLTPREYRIGLSFLRDKLEVVEVRMSAGAWDEINYEQVSSNAMNRYRKAFHVRDGERFREFLGKVEKGEESIKAGTLYPYDIVEKLMPYGYYREIQEDAVLEAQWKALPNYIEGEHNVLIMADVSGSMQGRPMATSVGLAIYFAERNRGPFKNLFMTFSASPQFVELSGYNLATRIKNAMGAHWQMNTDLEAAFMKVLEVAVRNRVSPADLPKAIVVISDMEIDAADRGARGDFLDSVRRRFANYGYELPKLVFWNVDSRKDTFLADGNRPGVELASGQSASTFRSILKSVNTTPYEAMLDVLNDERYACVVVPARYGNGTYATEYKAEWKTPVGPSMDEIRAKRRNVVHDLLKK